MNKRSFLQKLAAFALIPFVPKAEAKQEGITVKMGMPWPRFVKEYLNTTYTGQKFTIQRKIVSPGGHAGYEAWYFIPENLTEQAILFVNPLKPGEFAHRAYSTPTEKKDDKAHGSE